MCNGWWPAKKSGPRLSAVKSTSLASWQAQRLRLSAPAVALSANLLISKECRCSWTGCASSLWLSKRRRYRALARTRMGSVFAKDLPLTVQLSTPLWPAKDQHNPAVRCGSLRFASKNRVVPGSIWRGGPLRCAAVVGIFHRDAHPGISTSRTVGLKQDQAAAEAKGDGFGAGRGA